MEEKLIYYRVRFRCIAYPNKCSARREKFFANSQFTTRFAPSSEELLIGRPNGLRLLLRENSLFAAKQIVFRGERAYTGEP